MIGVFQGRGISEAARVYAQIDVDLRQHLNVFNDNGSYTSLAVFLALALHVNEHGWCWPGRELLMQETGASDEAITRALAHLRGVRIDGKRLLATYRERDPQSNKWGRSAYLIFPDLDHGPAPFVSLIEYRGDNSAPEAGFVYLIRATRGCKVGHTRTLAKRLRQLRYSEGGIEVLGWYPDQDAEGAVDQWLALWANRSIGGGWFDLEGDIQAFQKIALQLGGSTEDPKGQAIALSEVLVETAPTFEELFGPTPEPSPGFQVPEGMTPQEALQERVVAAHNGWVAKMNEAADVWDTSNAVQQWFKRRSLSPVGLILDTARKLEDKLGMRPVFTNPKSVNAWLGGLQKALEAADGDGDLVVSVGVDMRKAGLAIPEPYSLIKMTADAAAKRRVKAPAYAGIEWI